MLECGELTRVLVVLLGVPATLFVRFVVYCCAWWRACDPVLYARRHAHLWELSNGAFAVQFKTMRAGNGRVATREEHAFHVSTAVQTRLFRLLRAPNPVQVCAWPAIPPVERAATLPAHPQYSAISHHAHDYMRAQRDHFFPAAACCSKHVLHALLEGMCVRTTQRVLICCSSTREHVATNGRRCIGTSSSRGTSKSQRCKRRKICSSSRQRRRKKSHQGRKVRRRWKCGGVGRCRFGQGRRV